MTLGFAEIFLIMALMSIGVFGIFAYHLEKEEIGK